MKINKEEHEMSNNPNNSGKAPQGKTGTGQPQNNPAPAANSSGHKGQDPNAQDEYMKKLLEKMVQENPEGIAEIIHKWLNEDKKQK